MEDLIRIILLIIAAVPALIVATIIVVGVFTFVFSPGVAGAIFSDIRAIRERDPAAEGWIAAFFYPGWWALGIHRLVAHPLYKAGLRTPARLFNFLARFLTGTDIHPGAQFGRGIFIDHAHGTVIGETAIVGNNVTILHQVTLGGTGKDTGKRHPTIEDGVLLSAGSKVLGNIVIGRNSKIGAGSVVVHAVPPESTVVGVPGKVVASGGQRVPSQQMDVTTLPDPLVEKILEVQEELRRFKDKVKPNGQHGASHLSQPNDILQEIVAHKREEVAAVKGALPLDRLREKPSERKDRRSFYEALRQPGRLALIAEIKKASPSGGLLRNDFDPPNIAKIYEGAQASALSVLTNGKYFQGSLEHMTQARKATHLPILRKEFIVDEYQIVEAERHGADAVLLIVACLDLSQLRDFREAAEGEGLDALVEVHDEHELEIALKSGARIIGINNRNLRTLKTDLDTTFRVAKQMPRESRDGLILVSESGISKVEDTKRLLDAGIDAVLIGETFMRAQNIGEKVREVMGVMDFSI
ncbi:MAG TPA: indole-3-glycerol phosphate synthase TrpC [Planctomycetota bacterium]|nr:indole-3-glycerol phosphate synthase TrpC [Planctomycetota bacterium]